MPPLNYYGGKKTSTHIYTHSSSLRIVHIYINSAYKRQSRDIFEGSLSKQIHFPVCLGISVIN